MSREPNRNLRKRLYSALGLLGLVAWSSIVGAVTLSHSHMIVDDDTIVNPLTSIQFRGRNPSDKYGDQGADSSIDNFVMRTPQDEVFQQYDSFWRRPLSPKPILSYDHPTTYLYREPFGEGLWLGGVEFWKDGTAPARPNCSEDKFASAQFMALAKDPKVRSQNDFLKALPTGVLQKFTLMHESDSLQRQGVSFKHPRVIRFSTDARFALAYNSDPTSDSYGTIEAYAFNDQQRRFDFYHLDLRGQKQVVVNHPVCLSCHGGSDPRPNWDPYPHWSKAYGSDDDMLGLYNPSTKNIAWNAEGLKFQGLRTNLKEDPAVSTLPWNDPQSMTASHYPYIVIHKFMNYNYRPNAHLTVTASHLNAQRIARKIETHPAYPYFKTRLLMQVLGCEDAHLDGLFPDLAKLPDAQFSHLEQVSQNGVVETSDSELALYPVAHLLGLRSSDWELNFDPDLKGKYRGFSTGDFGMATQVTSVLLRDMAREIPELKPYDIRRNDFSNQFGRNFICVDEIANSFWWNSRRQEAMCQILRERDDEKTIHQRAKIIRESIASHPELITNNHPAREQEMAPSVAWGQRLAEKTCAQCHDGLMIPLNFKDSQHLAADLASWSFNVGDIKEKLGNDDHCEMPRPSAGPCLNGKEKASLLMYLRGLTK